MLVSDSCFSFDSYTTSPFCRLLLSRIVTRDLGISSKLVKKSFISSFSLSTSTFPLILNDSNGGISKSSPVISSILKHKLKLNNCFAIMFLFFNVLIIIELNSIRGLSRDVIFSTRLKSLQVTIFPVVTSRPCTVQSPSKSTFRILSSRTIKLK